METILRKFFSCLTDKDMHKMKKHNILQKEKKNILRFNIRKISNLYK